MDQTNDDIKPVDQAAPIASAPVTNPNQNQAPGIVPATEPATEPADDIETLKMRARLAMEGTEHTAKREKIEKERTLIEEKKVLGQRLEEIVKKKGEIELEWVKLDSQKKVLGEKLEPIIKEEDRVEGEEMKVETEEQSMGLAREKQTLEKKRWQIEDERRKLEQQKWTVEEKVWQVDDSVDQATKTYQDLLIEEERITSRLAEIERELI